MARDFGSGGTPTWRRGHRLAFVRRIGGNIGLLAALALFASLPSMMALSGGPVAAPPRAAGGPACRTISRTDFLRGWREDPRMIRFQGVAFARRRGDAFCSLGRDWALGRSFPVCEFDAPVELGVAAGGREAYFDVTPGLTAVVEVRREGLRCAITGRYGF